MLFDLHGLFYYVVAYVSYVKLRRMIWLQGFRIILLQRLRFFVDFRNHWRCTGHAEVTLIVLRLRWSRVTHQKSKLLLIQIGISGLVGDIAANNRRHHERYLGVGLLKAKDLGTFVEEGCRTSQDASSASRLPILLSACHPKAHWINLRLLSRSLGRSGLGLKMTQAYALRLIVVASQQWVQVVLPVDGRIG